MQDEHNGKGGTYVMVGGKRVLQARTGYVAPATPAPQAKRTTTQPRSNKQSKGVNNA